MLPVSQFARTNRRVLVAVLGCALALGGWLPGVPVAPAAAAPLTVTDCGDSGPGTLRGQIAAAGSGDTIVFVLNCTGSTAITLASTLTLTQSVTIDGTGHAVVVDGGCTFDGATATCTSGGVGAFAVNGGVTANLTALTIQHGNGGANYGGGGISNLGTLTVMNSTLSGNSAGVENGSTNYPGGGIFNSGGTLTVANSTISGNTANFGGGINNNRGTLTVANSTISGNSAGTCCRRGSGGGIYNLGGTVTVANSTISGNSSGILGGGIDNAEGPVKVTNSTLSGNTATNSGGGISSYSGPLMVANTTLTGNSAGSYGGGIFIQGTATVTNSTLSGNSARLGGGIRILDGTLTVAGSTLSGNSAGAGGGIFSEGTATVTNSTLATNSATQGGGIDNRGTLVVTNSALSGNNAYRQGGGIFGYSGTLTVTNSTFSANSAGLLGGGISNYSGTATVTNSTLSGNGAGDYGGGISNEQAAVTVTNTIVAGNAAGGGSDLYSAFTSGGHNLVGTTSGSTGITNGTNGDIVNPTPGLGTLGDNGGPTQTIPPLAGSPAIDAGDDTVCAGTGPAGVNNKDQRGITRGGNGAHCDIGAFEVVHPADTTPPVIAPTTTGTKGTNDWYTSNVQISWSVTDPESTISSRTGCDPTTITADTTPAGTALTCSATSAGGTGSQSVTIKRDATPPTGVAGTPDRAANANGWYNAPVTVTFNGSDATSGIASCTTGSYSGPDSATATVTGTCTDKAGNVGSGSFALKYDATKPTTGAAVTPTPNAAGWNKAAVAVTLSATDGSGGSGVATTYYALDSTACSLSALAGCATYTAGSPVPINTDGTHTLTYFSADVAGNLEAAKTLTVKIDTIPPTIAGTRTPAANANGWNNTDVTASFTCADNTGGSGIASCTAPVTVSAEGANQQVVGTATDVAGNSATATVSNIGIDKTRPTVTYTGNAGTYAADQTVSIACAAADNPGGSGIASSTCQNIAGPAYTFIIGANSYAASATDKAGNVGATATASFTVTASVGSVSNVVNQFVANAGQANSLTTKLAKGNIDAFINEVNAQTGKALTQEQAQVLIKLANALR